MAARPVDLNETIFSLRDASRKLVREWGFLMPTLAGCVLSAAATHCLLEIGDHDVHDFESLREVLQVNDDQLRRTLAELRFNGDIAEDPPAPGGVGPEDAVYRITPSGQVTLAAVNAYAQNQVEEALGKASPEARSAIVDALQQYAGALRRARMGSIPTPEHTPLASPRPSSPLEPAASSSAPVRPEQPAERQVSILTGYRPGILGRTLEMHMAYYSQSFGWGVKFESLLASTLSELLTRLDGPLNEAWCAVEAMPGGDNRIIGTILIDGEDLGEEGVAHLRAFIVDDSARGLGLGRKLFEAAMRFVREKGFRQCRLWTSRKLVVARRLYEEAGFEEVSEEFSDKFGKGEWHMEYCWRRKGEDVAEVGEIGLDEEIGVAARV